MDVQDSKARCQAIETLVQSMVWVVAECIYSDLLCRCISRELGCYLLSPTIRGDKHRRFGLFAGVAIVRVQPSRNSFLTVGKFRRLISGLSSVPSRRARTRPSARVFTPSRRGGGTRQLRCRRIS